MVKPELDASKDYYHILGISTSCSQVDIRKAFLDLARTQHPDKNPGQETIFKARFQTITTAYDVLKDPAAKRTYDQIRPAARKSAASTPNGAKATSAATGRSAFESATRTSAFPRQAKSAQKATPKSPPKKAPTARRDPFETWTPPVPAGKSRATPTPEATRSRTSASAQGAETPSGRASARRAPTAAHSAFFNASPSSPYNKQTSTSNKTNVPSSNRATVNPTKKTTGPARPSPDWTAKEKWWAQSGTAYSTFHGPSSKYSPYATQAGEKSGDSPKGPGMFADPPANKTDTMPEARTQFGTGLFSPGGFKSTTEYKWQQSRSAYQGFDSSKFPAGSERLSRKVPRVNPFGDIKAGNPFFEARSHRFGQRSESSNDEGDSHTKPTGSSVPNHTFGSHVNKQAHVDDASHESSESSGSSDNASDSDAFPTVDRMASDRPVQSKLYPERPIAVPQGFAKYRSASATLGSRTNEAPQNKDRPSTQGGKPFSFAFTPPPAAAATPSSSASRRVSANVPYVKFNAVPDLDFSSPSDQASSSAVHAPFSAGPNGETEASTSQRQSATDEKKKHDRLDDSPDPRFAKDLDDECATRVDSTSPFAETFAKFGLHDSSSPSKTPLQEELAKTEESSANRTENQTAPGHGETTKAPVSFTFPAKSSPLRTEPFTFTFGNEDVHGVPHVQLKECPTDVADRAPPEVPVLLTANDTSVPKTTTTTTTITHAFEQYMSATRKFDDYMRAWRTYEQSVLTGVRGAGASGGSSRAKYLEALARHRTVLGDNGVLVQRHMASMQHAHAAFTSARTAFCDYDSSDSEGG